MKRIIAILLAASMLLPLVACSTTDESGSEKDVAADTTPAIENAEDAGEELGEEDATPLPTAPVVDMEGKTFHIYNQQWSTYQPLQTTDIYVEEATGDSLNDAAYDRRIAIEEKLNCVVTQYEDQNITVFVNAQQASDASFDFILHRTNNFGPLITAGAIASIDNLTYFDENSPWWDANSYNEFAIDGYHMGVVGDITTNHYVGMYGIFFNKNMADEYNIPDLYQTVRDGKWTLDLMFEYCAQVAQDLDGDPATNSVDDQTGYSYIGSGPVALLHATGARIAETNSDGEIVIALGSEDALTKAAKIMELLQDDALSFNHHMRSTDAWKTEAGMFVEGRALFNHGAFYYIPELRLMDEEFGIIPVPKYNEEQTEYLSPMGPDYLTMVSIPKITADFEQLSVFMEWFAYYGCDLIRPELLEVLIKGKAARDVESIEFIEFIIDNRFYDIGAVFNFGGILTTLFNLYANRVGSLATVMPRLSKKVESAIADMVEAVNS